MKQRLARFEVVSGDPYDQLGLFFSPTDPIASDGHFSLSTLLWRMELPPRFVNSKLDPISYECNPNGRVYRFYFKRGALRYHKELIRIILAHKPARLKLERGWRIDDKVLDSEVPDGTIVFFENEQELAAMLPFKEGMI